MNPDEAWIGKVMAAGLIIFVISMISKLLRSKTEVAHRARLVIGGAIALAVAWVIFMVAGPVGFVITLAALGAVTWIAKGSK